MWLNSTVHCLYDIIPVNLGEPCSVYWKALTAELLKKKTGCGKQLQLFPNGHLALAVASGFWFFLAGPHAHKKIPWNRSLKIYFLLFCLIVVLWPKYCQSYISCKKDISYFSIVEVNSSIIQISNIYNVIKEINKATWLLP